MTAQKIEQGQLWRNKHTGREVVLTHVPALIFPSQRVKAQGQGQGERASEITVSTLTSRYTLVPDSEHP